MFVSSSVSFRLAHAHMRKFFAKIVKISYLATFSATMLQTNKKRFLTPATQLFFTIFVISYD